MFSHTFLSSAQFKYLGSFYLHSLIRLLAVSMFQLFSGLYLYQHMQKLGFSLQSSLAITALFFAIMYLSMAISIAPTIWLIAKKGLRFSVFWGNMFLVSFYISLYIAQFDPIFFFIAAILGGIEISLYWIAYHIYFSELTDDKKQGQELSIGALLQAVVLIAGPAFGGLLITYGGFGAVFLATVILVVFAVFPLRYLPKKKDVVKIDILKVVASLNPKKEIKSYLSLFGMGAGGGTSEIFWPIYTFAILTGFAGVGFMGSLTSFVASIATVVVGLLIDKIGPKTILKYIVPIDTLIWAAKSLVVSANQVYLISLFRGITSPAEAMSQDSLIYERARHENLVASIVQREVGLAIGRFLFMLMVGLLFWFGFPLVGILFLSGLLVLFIPLYPKTSLDK